MERKRQLPGPDGKPLKVTEVGFRATGEHWNEYLLDDGTVARVKLVDPSQSSEAEADGSPGTALDRLIARWAEIAVSHAMVRPIDDPAGHVATVAGIEGAWGFGDTEEGALDELRSVLLGWASLKLEDGDDDIPSMEGVHLVVNR